MAVNGIKMIVEAVDRNRRDAVQRRDKAKDPVSEMYYEGHRVALAEIQSFAKMVGEL